MQKHTYHIVCEYTQDADGQTPNNAPLVMDVELHENIFHIMNKMKEKEKLPIEAVDSFVLGLKLLGETLLHHKQEALCAEMLPHFTEMMKIIKKK